jgi:MOSC domain-containing protein YiiM
MEEVETVEVVADLGFAACAHARKGGSRQVLLVDKETLDEMELRPWQRLRIGTVLLQVNAVCTPCDQLEKVGPGLRQEVCGRRGILCCVLEGGKIRAGDAIQRVAAASS